MNEELNINEKVEEKKGFNITALILGIISLVFVCIIYISVPCAILTIIFFIIGRKKGGKGMGKAGLICSIISLILLLIVFLLIFTGIGFSSIFSNEIMEKAQEALNESNISYSSNYTSSNSKNTSNNTTNSSSYNYFNMDNDDLYYKAQNKVNSYKETEDEENLMEQMNYLDEMFNEMLKKYEL